MTLQLNQPSKICTPEVEEGLIQMLAEEIGVDNVSINDHLITDLGADQIDLYGAWFKAAKAAGFNWLDQRNTRANSWLIQALKKTGDWDNWKDPIKHAQRTFGIKMVAGVDVEAAKEHADKEVARSVEFFNDPHIQENNGILWKQLHDMMDGTQPLTVERFLWIVRDACEGILVSK